MKCLPLITLTLQCCTEWFTLQPHPGQAGHPGSMEVRGRQTSSLSLLYVCGCMWVAINWERGATLPLQSRPRDEVDSSVLLLGSFTSSEVPPPRRGLMGTQRTGRAWGQITWFATNLALFYFWQVLSCMLGYLVIWEFMWCQQRRNFDYLALGPASGDCSSNCLSWLSVTSSWELPSLTTLWSSGQEVHRVICATSL